MRFANPVISLQGGEAPALGRSQRTAFILAKPLRDALQHLNSNPANATIFAFTRSHVTLG